jgi:uncharacterized protein (TIGR00661 family)
VVYFCKVIKIYLAKLYKILIAPLDWGMGHAARCIPLIKYLQKTGIQVCLAVNFYQKKYFESEITDVEYIELEGYDIKYGKNAWDTTIKLLGQVPKIFRKIKAENAWLEKAIETYQIDAIISDNRYGLYSQKIPSVIITHQIAIEAPIGEALINYWNRKLLKNFLECWVPDYESNLLSGKLSVKHKDLNIKYIGPLSRFERKDSKPPEEKCLLIMSGVEPQKSIFRDIVIAQAKKINIPLTIVGNDKSNFDKKIISHKMLNTSSLQDLINGHKYILSRTGYTTIMDLYTHGRKAILVPTPGQTEQEYLGKFHTGKQFIIQQQNNFDLKKGIQDLNYLGTESAVFNIIYPQIISDWLAENKLV